LKSEKARYEEEVDSPDDIKELKRVISNYKGIAIENGQLKSDKRELVKKVETLKNMSTVEMMCENKSVEQHVTEWEKRCLKAEEELSDLHVRYAALCALCGTGRSEIERLERRDEVWREKKRILENDLAKAWADKQELVEAIAGLFRDSDCSVNWEKAMTVVVKHIEK
jgi:predicted  nucleic acid-binding Zn-ribbon protein